MIVTLNVISHVILRLNFHALTSISQFCSGDFWSHTSRGGGVWTAGRGSSIITIMIDMFKPIKYDNTYYYDYYYYTMTLCICDIG